MNFKRILRGRLAAAFTMMMVLSFSAIAQSGFTHNGPNLRSPGQIGYLSGPQRGDHLTIALDFIDAHKNALGLSSADLAGLVVTDNYTSQGMTHIYLSQTQNGVRVQNGQIGIHLLADGSISNITNNFVPKLADSINLTRTEMTAVDAARIAADHLGLSASFSVKSGIRGSADSETLLASEVARDDVRARLVYQPLDESVTRLAWSIELHEVAEDHWWIINIDAATGKMLFKHDYYAHDTFHTEAFENAKGRTMALAPVAAAAASGAKRAGAQYEVYELPKEYPNDGDRTIVKAPENLTASPFGWHDTDGAAGAEFTITRGNNVHAFQDRNDSDTSSGDEPDGGASLDFTGALVALDLGQGPETYINAAVVNLFYFNNIIHDVMSLHGFDAASGNFQANNYGEGGLGNDDVKAHAQDGADIGNNNNANFGTPPDGSNPTMQMFTWVETSPGRDGDFSNMIIAHEYGHGISNRLTGGPSNTSCLGNSEQMGEGWSDWFGLVLTAVDSDTATTPRGVGTYVLGEPVDGAGIRPRRYTTDTAVNEFTYSGISGVSIPHGVGFVWSTMLWDMYWALVDQYGFNPNIYADWTTGGNNLALRLVLDGCKLQPCSPGFVDGRDAILQADMNLTGGANQCLIWETFAARGLGVSADQGSTGSVSDGTEAFDLPGSCDFIGATPAAATICTGSMTTIEVGVGNAFTPPVTLVATSTPSGLGLTFDTNPITSVPATAMLTVDATGAAAGNYAVSIAGTGSLGNDPVVVNITIVDAAPGATTNTAPADGGAALPLTTLRWMAPDAVSTQVEVATDAGFTNVIIDQNVVGTSMAITSPLSAGTYFWRTTGTNPCGTGAQGPATSFTVGGATAMCSTPSVSIPDNTPTGVNDALTASASGTILDLEVSIDITHTWIGDLQVYLTHNDTGTVVVLQEESGCREDNIDATLNDAAATSIDDECFAGIPARSGFFIPSESLSAFIGEDVSGTWTLNVNDNAGQDTGTLNAWCINVITTGGGGPTGGDTLGVFRPSSNTFYFDNGSRRAMGAFGDQPIIGDWNGDGVHDMGVFRPGTPNTFYMRTSTGTTQATIGQMGDIPVIGDWNGDGHDSIGVFRPSNNTFYVRYSGPSGATRRAAMGASGDLPIVGDWDGDGDTDIGVKRGSSFFLRPNTTFSLARSVPAGLLGTDQRHTMGATTDWALIGDWNGDGDSDIGVFRPSNNGFYMRNLDVAPLGRMVDGFLGSDDRHHMGAEGDWPLAGTWE